MGEALRQRCRIRARATALGVRLRSVPYRIRSPKPRPAADRSDKLLSKVLIKAPSRCYVAGQAEVGRLVRLARQTRTVGCHPLRTEWHRAHHDAGARGANPRPDLVSSTRVPMRPRIHDAAPRKGNVMKGPLSYGIARSAAGCSTRWPPRARRSTPWSTAPTAVSQETSPPPPSDRAVLQRHLRGALGSPRPPFVGGGRQAWNQPGGATAAASFPVTVRMEGH